MIFLLGLPVVYLIWRTVLRRRVEVGHREAFTLGFLWYAAMPMFIAAIDVDLNSPALRGWRAIATLMGPARQQTELLWGVGIWASFVAGSLAVARTTATSPPPPDGAHALAWRVVLLLTGTAALAFALSWGVANRALLFTGYAATEFDDVVRGPLQAALLYTSVAAIIAGMRRRSIGILPVLINGVAALLMILLSLSIGTRGATVLVAVMLIALASRLRGGLPRLPLIGGGVAALGALAALAAWRLGSSDFGFALLTPALESLYTYFSAATYLAFNNVSAVAFPCPLLGAVGNLIPRVLWPGKVDFLDSLLADINMFAPLGATHLFASLLINFGWVGSLAAVFAAGAGVERLSLSQRPACIAACVMIVGVLTTDVWRNPFSQSLIKSVLQGALLVPLTLTLAAIVATRLRGSARAQLA